jgi:hypothetical protein
MASASGRNQRGERGSSINRSRLLTVPLLLASRGVSAAVSAMTATGGGALALASLVADPADDPVARPERAEADLDGRAAVTFRPDTKSRCGLIR